MRSPKQITKFLTFTNARPLSSYSGINVSGKVLCTYLTLSKTGANTSTEQYPYGIFLRSIPARKRTRVISDVGSVQLQWILQRFSRQQEARGGHRIRNTRILSYYIQRILDFAKPAFKTTYRRGRHWRALIKGQQKTCANHQCNVCNIVMALTISYNMMFLFPSREAYPITQNI